MALYNIRIASGISMEYLMEIYLSQIQYCNLGQSLATGDVRQAGYSDLVIGAPMSSHDGVQSGMVGILLAGTSRTGW